MPPGSHAPAAFAFTASFKLRFVRLTELMPFSIDLPPAPLGHSIYSVVKHFDAALADAYASIGANNTIISHIGIDISTATMNFEKRFKWSEPVVCATWC